MEKEKGKAGIEKVLVPVHNFMRKIHYNSPVILTYTIASFIILLLDMAASGQLNPLLFSVYQSPLDSPLTYIRVFGYAFGHVNFEHFFNNFLLVLLVGPALEEKYGSKKLLLMMLVTIVSTGIMHMFISPEKRLLGASGVVFMMIILSSFVNLSEGRIPLTLILSIIVFIGKEIMSGVLITDNVSRITHIIGGVLGAVFGIIINRKKLLPKKEKIPAEPEPEKDEPEESGEIIYMTDKKPE